MNPTLLKVKRGIGLAFPPRAAPTGWEAYPDWPRLLKSDWGKWNRAIKRAKGGPRVLIPTSLGGYLPGATFESLLAVALTLRGAEVHILLCDQYLPACQQVLMESTPDPLTFARSGVSPNICRDCFNPANYM